MWVEPDVVNRTGIVTYYNVDEGYGYVRVGGVRYRFFGSSYRDSNPKTPKRKRVEVYNGYENRKWVPVPRRGEKVTVILTRHGNEKRYSRLIAVWAL